MTEWPGFLVDAVISLSAGLGAVIVLSRIDRLIPVPDLAARFRFTLWTLAVLMSVRVIHWVTGGWISGTVTFWAATLLPLSALLLAELLLRRHAPPALKWWAGVGVVLLLVAGPVPWGETARVGALLVFQFLTLVWVAGFVLTRDRDSLSAAENRSIDRMTWSFALILPFMATDFLRDDASQIPARMGGIAVLALCWLAISLNRPGLSTGRIGAGVIGILAVVAVLSAVLAELTGMGMLAGVQTAALLTAAILLLAVWQAALGLSIEDTQGAVLREMARSTDPAGLIQSGSGAPDALVLEEPDLEDCDIEALQTLFSDDPVRTRTKAGDEQLDWLFTRFEATHLVCLSTRPLRLVALANPALAGAEGDASALRALQRMAALLERPTA